MFDSNFEVGEEVFIDSSRYGESAFRPVTVKRVTKTLAIVEQNGVEYKFSQDGGRQVPRGDWYNDKLVRNSEQVQKALRAEERRTLLWRLKDAVTKVHPLEPTVEQANAVHKAYYEWADYKVEKTNA